MSATSWRAVFLLNGSTRIAVKFENLSKLCKETFLLNKKHTINAKQCSLIINVVQSLLRATAGEIFHRFLYAICDGVSIV